MSQRIDDEAEKMAFKYLERLGFDPVHEPNGRSTIPDFEIDKTIAVEVRRLNKNYFPSEKVKALHEESQSISDSINSIFAESIKLKPKQNFWVRPLIKRPIGDKPSIRKKLIKVMRELLEEETIQVDTIEISQSVVLRLSPKSEIDDQVFHLNEPLDLDSAGYVIPTLLENMNYCIEEKTEKYKNAPKQYDQFWLVLVDEFSRGALEDLDEAYIVENVIIPPVWEKVISLNALTGEEILKIERKKRAQ